MSKIIPDVVTKPPQLGAPTMGLNPKPEDVRVEAIGGKHVVKLGAMTVAVHDNAEHARVHAADTRRGVAAAQARRREAGHAD